MNSFSKFLALVVAGFALGAGAAWLQHPHSMETATATGASAPAAPDASQLAASTAARIAKKAAAVNAAVQAVAPQGDEKKQSDEMNTAAKADTPAATDAKPAAPDNAGTNTGTAGFTLSQSVNNGGDGMIRDGKTAKSVDPVIPTGVGGAFSLIDHNGNQVTEKSWPGKYLMVFFGFTHCPDVCPVTLDKLTSVLDALGPDVAKVQTLYITVDPSRDTVGVMKDYLGHFHKSMLGLTGSDEQVKAAQDAYKVYASRRTAPNGSDYSFDHSAFVYFMTPDNQLAEIIKVEDKPTDITDKIKPWLSGDKKLPTP